MYNITLENRKEIGKTNKKERVPYFSNLDGHAIERLTTINNKGFSTLTASMLSWVEGCSGW